MLKIVMNRQFFAIVSAAASIDCNFNTPKFEFRVDNAQSDSKTRRTIS